MRRRLHHGDTEARRASLWPQRAQSSDPFLGSVLSVLSVLSVASLPLRFGGSAVWFCFVGPRWRKVLRDLWRNRTRTVLVVLSIAVGVFAVGTIAGTRMMLAEDLAARYAATNPASAVLFTSPFGEDLVRAVRRMDGVREVEGRRRATVRLQIGPDQWRDLRLEVHQDFEDIRLDKITLVHGTWPPDKREVLLERSFLANARANVGDTLTVETRNGKRHELVVAGLVHDLNKPPAAFTSIAQGYVTFATFEALGFPRDYNELHLLVSERPHDKKHIQAIADAVKRKVEYNGRTVSFVEVRNPGEHPASETVNALLLILGALGALSLFLSGLLVVNTIMAVLAQQVPQIGVMKAIGARTGQVMGLYLGMVLIYGVLALAIAVPFGAAGAYAFTAYIAGLINFDLMGFRVPPVALAIEIAIALVVPLLAAAWPIVAGARVTVREAIAGYGLGRESFGASRTDRLIERATGVLRSVPRPLLLSLRNTFRRKARLALTLFTLSLAGAIYIGVLSVHSSLLATLDDALAYWRYDVTVDFRQSQRIDRIVYETKQVPGVVEAESWAFNSVRRVRDDGREGPSFSMVAPPAETKLLRPIVLQGRWLLPGDDNALVVNTEVLKNEPDLKIGDEITLKLNGRETTWRLAGIVRAVMTGPTGYAKYASYAQAARAVGRAGGVRVVTERHDPASQNRMAVALKEHLDGAGLPVNATSTIAQQRRNIETQFNILVVFLAIMAVLLAVVGGLGLMGTMAINVLERAREIGVMRAIGASNAAVFHIFLAEGLFIGVLSWLAGTLASLPISRLLSDIVGNAFMRAPLTYTFSAGGAAAWLTIVLVLAALASFLPSWRASRLTVREVLAYE
ncbi:MAG: FtsX-like permease family protein [Chloroflexi bacterium]|nr:FtsX-like permease family protein [Chloroflexota bacterium]